MDSLQSLLPTSLPITTNSKDIIRRLILITLNKICSLILLTKLANRVHLIYLIFFILIKSDRFYQFCFKHK